MVRAYHAVVVVMLATAFAGSACGAKDPEAPPATAESPVAAPANERVVGPLSPDEAKAMATMTDRLKEYVDLHIRLERTLPALPKEATPEQIDRNQRALGKLIQEARASAKIGEIFTPEAQPVIKRLLATIFGGPDGAQLKASIMDENPVDVKVTVNGRYPDTVPVSTIPPQVLQTLPELPEELEYRFIGDRLILFDTHAHIIADYIEDALP